MAITRFRRAFLASAALALAPLLASAQAYPNRAIKLAMEIGSISEKVEVVGGSSLVQTQATAITSTVRVDQISNLPLITRNALNFVVFLPSVDTSASNHSWSGRRPASAAAVGRSPRRRVAPRGAG